MNRFNRTLYTLLISSAIFLSCKKVDPNNDPGNGNGGGGGTTGTELPANPVMASVAGLIVDENNNPMSGVSIKCGANTTGTNSSGNFTFTNITLDKNKSLVTATRSGYFKGYRVFSVSTTGNNFIKIQLIKKPTAAVLSGSTGGTVTTGSGSIVFPANSFSDAVTGAAYTGTVYVYAKLIDPSQTNIATTLPGGMIGLDANNKNVVLQSFGMIAVDIETTTGQKLQISSGKKATITYPIVSAYVADAPATIPLWYVDDATGIWKQEGTATRSGSNYTGTVSHFSFWNWDIGFNWVTLDMTLKNSNGDPLAHTLVKISIVNPSGNQFVSACGYTNSNGHVGGIVPSNANLSMQVLSDCNAVLDTRSLGVLTQNTNLGNLTINLGPNEVVLGGTVKNCNDAPLPNAQLSLFFENKIILFTADAAGAFHIALTKCTSSGYTLIAKDPVSGQVSIPYFYQASNPINTTLTLKACAYQAVPFFVSTLAGQGFGLNGWVDGPGNVARFWHPQGVATDAAGNIYVADTYNNRIRKITPAGVTTTIAGTGVQGFADGPAGSAMFDWPRSICVASDGTIYVDDFRNNRIRKISNGIVSTYVGTGVPTNTDGPIATATVASISNMMIDSHGDMFFGTGYTIKKISNGVVSTYMGDSFGGYVDGPIASARIWGADQLAIDSLDNLYFTETIVGRVRKITVATGMVSTLAGLPASNSPGISEGGFGTYARLNQPVGITVGVGGFVYICETNGVTKIKKITPEGYVTTVAGDGNLGFTSGPGLTSQFQTVYSLAADRFGNIYVADALNQAIRKVNP